MNNEIELLKREVDRKNNELVDYLNSLKMDLRNNKHVKFNDNLKNQNVNNDFIKNNYDSLQNDNEDYYRYKQRRLNNNNNNTNQLDYMDNNNNQDYNLNYDENNFDNLNENEYNNNHINNNYGKYHLNTNKIQEKRSINLKSSSTMIFNREEFLNERNNNTSNNALSASDSKISKFASIGRNLIAESEFIPIHESIIYIKFN